MLNKKGQSYAIVRPVTVCQDSDQKSHTAHIKQLRSGIRRSSLLLGISLSWLNLLAMGDDVLCRGSISLQDVDALSTHSVHDRQTTEEQHGVSLAVLSLFRLFKRRAL